MRRLALVIMMLMVLAGCARPEPAPSTQPPEPVPTEMPQPQPPAPAPTEALPATLTDLIKPAPAGALERVEVAPGQPVGRPGIYFMDPETGSVTGWATPDGLHPQAFGGRWIYFRGQTQTLLADRTTGAILQWPSEQASLLATGGEHLLVKALDRLWVLKAGPAGARPLDLAPRNPQALFSPNGRSLLLLNDARLYRVETPSGAVRELDRTPGEGVTLQPARRGQEALLSVRREGYDLWGRAGVSLRRYSFDGRVLTEGVKPTDPWFSPDGKLAFWHDDLGSGSPSVTVGTADRLEPLVRVRGASACAGRIPGDGCWLADGSGLLVQVEGGYRVLRTDGRLVELPGLARAGSLLPAPHRPDRYIINGTQVADSKGKVLSELDTRAANGSRMSVAGGPQWGAGGAEVIFVLGWYGKGSIYSPPPVLDPLAERGSLQTISLFQVKVPAGDCLNLRAAFGAEGPVLRCLPSGSRLIAARGPGRLNKGWIEYFGDMETTDWGGTWWLHVRTEQGDRGFVAFRPDLLAFAPGPVAPFPADPLTVRIQDEASNLDRWLAVALGEAPCGPACSDSSLEGAVLGLINRCQAGFADLKKPDGYGAAVHGPILGRMESACSLLGAGVKSIGHPADAPAWRERVRETRSVLK